MNSLAFLGVAALVCLLGFAIVAFLNRERHSTFEGSIEQHKRKLDALSDPSRGRRRRR